MQWNEPGAQYSLVEKEKPSTLPFSIDQEGGIYVTQPLDREEKDSVSKSGRSFTDSKTECSAYRQLNAESILHKNNNDNQSPKPCSGPQYIISLKDMKARPQIQLISFFLVFQL